MLPWLPTNLTTKKINILAMVQDISVAEGQWVELLLTLSKINLSPMNDGGGGGPHKHISDTDIKKKF